MKESAVQVRLVYSHPLCWFFHDLILAEVLELDRIVWFTTGSACQRFDLCSCAFNIEFDAV